MQDASRAALNRASNGVGAEENRLAESEVPEIDAAEWKDRSALTNVSKSRTKVTDKLKAAVKQVDKQVHEVIAVPMPQNVALAPHKQEHPGARLHPFLRRLTGFCGVSRVCFFKARR